MSGGHSPISRRGRAVSGTCLAIAVQVPPTGMAANPSLLHLRCAPRPLARTWLAGRKRTALPASPALLAALGSSGVKLDEQQVGACLSEYYVPAEYKNEEVRILKTAGCEKVEIEPAAYEWVEEKVLVKEASEKIAEVPAEFETVTEKVLVAPATTAWKTGRGPAQRIDNSTGEIMCLVEIPAKYETVTRKLIKTPATTKEVEIPAEYAVQRVQRLVKPAQERRVKVEPTYETLSKSVPLAEARFFWHPDWEDKPAAGRPTGNTVCLRETQVKAAGFDPGPIDGLIGAQTMRAVDDYRRAKGMERGGLTLSTLEALGVNN